MPHPTKYRSFRRRKHISINTLSYVITSLSFKLLSHTETASPYNKLLHFFVSTGPCDLAMHSCTDQTMHEFTATQCAVKIDTMSPAFV